MIMINAITWLEVCAAGLVVYITQRFLFTRNPAPLPPGPKPLPLVGNLFDIPVIKPWLTYADWGKKYGDITHIQVFGRHIILLNSVEAAVEMLDKKSAKYSDRPVFPMAGDLVGCKDSLPLLSYGDRFREIRKHFHRVIGTRTAIEEYYGIKAVEIHKFLRRILIDPERLDTHIRVSRRRTVGAIILRISHGYQVKETNDYFINLAEQAVDIFGKATAPGAFLVDSIPILKYVPEWFPGTGFKRKAREWKVVIDELLDRPYQFVKDQMTAAAIHSMFLAMTLYPEVQKKAQAEIDAIISLDRLPTLSDRQSLPYIEALVKEIHRWHVVSSLDVCLSSALIGFPHRVSEEDIHDGYYIPKGSLVIPNLWFMLHNPRSFSGPMEFRPERFLVHGDKQPEHDPRTACFGFGRRLVYLPWSIVVTQDLLNTMLAGSLLGDALLWLLTAMTLAVFDITKAIEDGKEITPEIDSLSGAVSRTKPFRCSIQPRSTKALELIQQDIQC
ncbi:cytochrome P450 [Scleroderma yunnanense]